MEDKGFFEALFDTSFESFVFPKVVKFIYIVIIIFLALGYLAMLIAGFSQSAAAGLGALILGPIALLLYLIFVRAGIEVAMVMFRINANVKKMLDMKERDQLH